MKPILYDIFENANVICGDKEPEKPELCNFVGSCEAIRLLNKHIKGNLPIAVHADVDMDGIGSAYIMQRFLSWVGAINRTGFLINKEKVHGISEKHVEFFKKNRIGLLIVLDSSTNEIEHIKNMNCDVLVIDHHEIGHSELSGDTAGGRYVIVNNMQNNSDTAEISRLTGIEIGEYKADARMSCGLVVYELLRIYSLVYGKNEGIDALLQNSLIDQWVGVTLFTDIIHLSNNRNQYYVDRLIYSYNIEPCLKQMLNAITTYKQKVDKSFILYTLGPKVNKAIRANASGEALDIVLNRPSDIVKLDEYKEEQNKALDNIVNGIIAGLADEDRYVIRDITGLGIKKGYTGVIAANLLDLTGKNAVACLYNEELDLYEGSFRGKYGEVNYREHFLKKVPDIYVQGHGAAFGIKATMEQIHFALSDIEYIEKEKNSKYYLTAGRIPEGLKGIHHIDDMEVFKKEKGMIRLAIANSKLSSEEAINIILVNDNNFKATRRGKVLHYEIMGLKCIAFEELTSNLISLYVEYTDDLTIYARNVR